MTETPPPGLLLAGYEITEKLGESPQAAVYGGFHKKSPDRPLLLKVLKSKSLSESQKSHFRLKIEHLKVLHCPQAILPLSFEERGETRFIIQDCFEGTTLDRWAALSFKDGVVLGDFFEVACRVAQVLDDVHKAGIIHGGVKPHNILVQPATLDIRLVDFITPFDVRDVSHFIYDRAFVEGTLAYTSPEQTGRINHRVDFTTDLYSLGIIFYELLTGRLPFRSTDPLDLIHSHLAEQAPPVHALNPSIPPTLSRVVAKLTLKQPEKRYQSASGLYCDLKSCRDQHVSTGSIEPFPLGRYDQSHRVVFVSKMVGRDREASIVLDEYDRAAAGAFRCVLISGLPGIGKTRLIQELQRPIVRRRGYFTSGKFDVYQKNIPYSSLIQALRNLVRTFLTESDERVALWKEKILAAVGTNGRVITDVIPELVVLIGAQPEVPPLPPVESRTRFHDLFGRFLTCLVSEEHPLTMFIDDLQWSDADSFDFLSNIVADFEEHPYLCLLGAYRYNEVDSSHPLSKLIRHVTDNARPLKEIRLGPLEVEHCHEMVSYILDSPLSQTEALAGFIANLTEGNPLFVSESLSYLHNENLLLLDANHCWQWDLDRIRQSDMPSSIVALFSSKVRRLPPMTVGVLEYCACMGNSFSADELALVRETALLEIFESLKPALGMGLLMEAKNQLQFIHDRVQEAVLGDIDQERRRDIHWRVGNCLLSRIPEGAPTREQENLFTIASHLNLGRPLLPDASTAYRLSDINFQAGEKALNSLATEAANEYYQYSLQLLPPDCWEVQYDRTFKIIQKLAKTELMVGRYEGSEKLLDQLLDHAKTDLDKAEALAEQTTSLSSIGNFKRAIETANRGLDFFGKSIADDAATAEKKRERLMNEITSRPDAIWTTILNMPFTKDRKSKIELAFYSELIPDLYMSGLVPQLYLSAVQSTEHCLQGGMDESVIYSFSIMGLYLGEKGDFEQAFLYEDLARELSDRHPNTFGATRGMNGVVWCNMHSRSHPEEVVKYCLRSIQCGRNCGDLYNAGLSYGPLMWNLQVQGADLAVVEEYTRECLQFSQKYRLRFSVGLAEAVIAGWIGPMKGQVVSIPIEERLRQWQEENHIASAGSYHVLRAASHYLSGEYQEAEHHLQEVTRYLNGLTDNVLKREWHVFQMLTAIKLHEQGAGYRSREELLSYVHPIHKRVSDWAALGPTLRPYLAFVDAELERVGGNFGQARNRLMDAIAAAHQQRFTLLEGHLNEGMGELLERAKQGTFPQWFAEAARLYKRCGAVQKLQRLLERYPECVAEEAPTTAPAEPEAAIGATLPPLDSYYLMRSSLAIAGETDAESLLGKIMKAVLQASGAQHGFLVIEERGRLVVCAESHISDTDVVRTDKYSLENATEVCTSIVRYVWRTRESLILGNASEDGPFRDNSEVRRLGLRSVLCLPLTKQAEPGGVLYLENRLSDSVFTADRTMVTELLSSQAAISLQHARLLAERNRAERLLRESNDYLDKLLNHANAAIVVCDPDFKIVRFNHAFEHLTGYAAPEVIGSDLSVLFPDSTREESLVARESREPVEIPVRRKDGETRILLWSSAGIYAEDGKALLAIMAQGQDITDRKRLAEQLLQSQKMEGLGQLASGIAHDFNNVLCGIMGFADIALRRIDKGHPVHAYLNKIALLSDRGSELVHQLLAFARREVLRPAVLKVNGIIVEFLELIRKTLGETIEIVFRPDPHVQNISGDRVQIEQVLMNLCLNARDAMPTGGTIVIETENVALDPNGRGSHPEARPGPYVVVTVSDNGVGMDKGTLDRVFEPFFTTKSRGRGTGLGLSMVHGIVAQHHGFVTVESEPGRGTRFRIYLPAQAQTATKLPETQEAVTARGAGETVLVVDDDEGVLDAASAVLKEYGYTVLTAKDGEEGLRLFQAHAASTRLVICDVVMPRMSGPEFYQKIRGLSSGVGFLFMSGYPLGMYNLFSDRTLPECILKPFTGVEFAQRVRKALGGTA